MLIGRHDIENLMRRDPASACLPCSTGELNTENSAANGESSEVEMEISDVKDGHGNARLGPRADGQAVQPETGSEERPRDRAADEADAHRARRS